MKKVLFVLSVFCTVFLISAVAEIPVNAAEAFDPVYYAAAYPDVAAAVGTDAAALLNHYLLYGKNEGRLPNASAEPGAEIEVFNEENLNQTKGFEPVPMAKLANLSSLRKKATEEQLIGIAKSLRAMVDSGMVYSMSAPHYNDPYGYFILHTASCAGCTRATGLCLNILGIPYEHVNENQYSHQWCRVNVNGTYWICDAYGLYCGPEPAPYTHPYLQ